MNIKIYGWWNDAWLRFDQKANKCCTYVVRSLWEYAVSWKLYGNWQFTEDRIALFQKSFYFFLLHISIGNTHAHIVFYWNGFRSLSMCQNACYSVVRQSFLSYTDASFSKTHYIVLFTIGLCACQETKQKQNRKIVMVSETPRHSSEGWNSTWKFRRVQHMNSTVD